ncbi:MAG: cysteine synthase family protein [Acidobacteriota bacterium]|jgi:cystathionine beta-synthase (O-acetyl-L-serine)
MKLVENVLDVIGNTPMIHLSAFKDDGEADIYAKLEYLNPAGSVKDRIGLAMVLDAENSGRLGPGGTVLEATAGNTGISVALAGIQRGYRVIIVMPQGYAPEKMALVQGLGAELVLTPAADKMPGAIAKAEELAKSIPGAVPLRQFTNPANPQAHYNTTAPEIWEQMGGNVDGIAVGAGSGGTFTGLARYFKERNPDLLAYVVEPPGSLFGGNPFDAPHRVEGIGNNFWPDTLDRSLMDGVFTIPDEDTYGWVNALGRLGILAASSSGANLAGAKRLAKQLGEGKRVVTLFPDSSERYLNKYCYDGKVDGKALHIQPKP